MKKYLKLLIFFSFIIVLSTAINLEAVFAKFTEHETVLPDYLLRFTDYLSKGNATKLAEIRNQMIEQLKINQDRIASTKGAVLHSLKSSPLLESWPPTFSFMSSVEFTSPYEDYGYIESAEDLVGSEDDSFAHFHTDGWNENYQSPMGGESFAAGYLYGSQWASGDFYIYGKAGPHSGYGYSNYVMVYVSNDINEDFGSWTFLGYVQVLAASEQAYYIGTSFSTWSCIAIMCWTPPPYPIYYYPLVLNCVNIDYVGVDNWY